MKFPHSQRSKCSCFHYFYHKFSTLVNIGGVRILPDHRDYRDASAENKCNEGEHIRYVSHIMILLSHPLWCRHLKMPYKPFIDMALFGGAHEAARNNRVEYVWQSYINTYLYIFRRRNKRMACRVCRHFDGPRI